MTITPSDVDEHRICTFCEMVPIPPDGLNWCGECAINCPSGHGVVREYLAAGERPYVVCQTCGLKFTKDDYDYMVRAKGGYLMAPTDAVVVGTGSDMVNHPAHYTRGPTVTCPACEHSWMLECIEVIEHIRDVRLATAVKYIWRVGFGGKNDDVEDINKSRWYLARWIKVRIDADA